MKLEEYVLSKKKSVNEVRKELEEKELDFLNAAKSLKFFSKKGLDVSYLKKDGHDFYVTNNDSFYSMVKGYSVQNSHQLYGEDFSYERGSLTNWFFQWRLSDRDNYYCLMNENDFDFMKIYSESYSEEDRDSGYCTYRVSESKVEHGKGISEIIHYFMKKGVSFDVLSNLEKDIVKLRENNPVKVEEKGGYL